MFAAGFQRHRSRDRGGHTRAALANGKRGTGRRSARNRARMIEAVLNGRLGNCLFQYAAARALALKTGTAVQLNLGRYIGWLKPLGGEPVVKALGFFRIEATYTRLDIDVCRALEGLGLRERRQELTEAAWGYDPRFAELGRATRLIGYFQSPRYWTGAEAVLRAELARRSAPDDASTRSVIDAVGGAGSAS